MDTSILKTVPAVHTRIMPEPKYSSTFPFILNQPKPEDIVEVQKQKKVILPVPTVDNPQTSALVSLFTENTFIVTEAECFKETVFVTC